jgi:hypothetical protein
MTTAGIDVGAPPAPRFREWLRPKLSAYVALAVAICLGLLVVPAFVEQFHAQFFPDQAFREAAWWDYAPLAWLRRNTGLGLLPLLWLLPAAVALAWFAVMLAFEGLAWRLRLDRGDDAWTSFTWALRSWRAWLRWLLRAALWAALGLIALALPERWRLAGTVPGVVALASLPFLAFNAVNLRPASPPVRFRMRWPGAWPFAVGVVGIVLMEAADLLAKLSGKLWVVLPVWVVSLAIAAFLLVGWMDRSPPSRWAANLHRATRPRVMGAMATQGLRLGLVVIALWLVLLPAAVLLLHTFGDFNGALATWIRAGVPTTAEGGVVEVARFATSWWWLGLMALFALPATPLTWFAAVGSGRLLVQLGAVCRDPGSITDNPGPTP